MAGFGAKQLWRRASLMQRLAFVALAPTLVAASLLTVILTHYQMITLREMGQGSAEVIATQAASITAAPMQNMRRRELIRIAESIASLPHVAQVQIRAANGEILADSQSQTPSGPRDNLTVVRDVLDPDRPQAGPLGSVMVIVSLGEAIAAQRASLNIALVALALSLLLAAVIAWQAARWISAPLRRLASAVHELGHGDTPVTVPVTDQTEIGDLQHGFNTAAAALLDIRRSMEREIEQATRELARKNMALEEASVAKARFLAAASHDLRQPLYALTLFSSALAVDESDPARLDRIAHIQECVSALDHLFSELLDLSRLETGTISVEISEFPLDGVFDEVSCNFRMIAEQRDLRLVIRPTTIWVRGDRSMVARMLNNLVSNALRYTHEGGVLVGARHRRDGSVRIDVWDTGNGIPDEHRERIFDEFYRVDQADHSLQQKDSHSHNHGLGLGLATVQRLAQLLDTRVLLASRPGRGSVFSFHLDEAPSCQPALPSGTDTPATDLTGLRVLVIDDEPAILSGIRHLLRSWGCEVAAAEDRSQALALAEAWTTPPDLVISDLRLRAGKSGLDVLTALDHHYRDHPPFRRLLITGETRSDRLREIKAARIPVLYKPVSPEQLREAVAGKAGRE